MNYFRENKTDNCLVQLDCDSNEWKLQEENFLVSELLSMGLEYSKENKDWLDIVFKSYSLWIMICFI